uniref:Uncharacterized protein n=1 Tax=Ananas comosus var. bracteatus TaxID=296719 RepID=A0A6V7PNI5_ANACO|nr:unnamed protein product [Ananas comosus var. bracteatus]
MPHPSSLSLAYEQAKLKESIRELGYFPTIYTSIPSENARVNLIVSWCKQSDQVKCNLKEQPNTNWCQGMKHYTDKRRSEGVLEGEEQIYPELLPYKHSSKTMEKIPELPFCQYTLCHISEQTSRAARRLRLPEGPKGEPRPSRSRRPCCQPEVLGEGGHNGKHLKPAQSGVRKQNKGSNMA